MRKNVTFDLHTCVKMVPNKNVNIKLALSLFPITLASVFVEKNI